MSTLNLPANKRVRVKICGITNTEDAEGAVACGADALGFIFHEPSPRYFRPEKALEIIKSLPPFVQAVGVFVNKEIEEVLSTAVSCQLDIIQLHGDENPGYCEQLVSRISEQGSRFKVVKAVRVKDEQSLQDLSSFSFTSALLLDSYSNEEYGGSGEKFDWSLARSTSRFGRIILAGGLNPENVGEAICEVRPYAVDVSSSVEREPGRKDHGKLREFFDAVAG